MLFLLRVQTILFVPEKDESSGCSWREGESLEQPYGFSSLP